MSCDATIVLQWSPNWSKNVSHGGECSGRLLRRQALRDMEATLAEKLSDTGPWYRGKTWLDIHIEMPNRRSDAINLLESIADAVSKAIGIEDRWFAVHKLDWEIKKEDPTIAIRVFQDVDQDYHYCSTCMKLYKRTGEFFYKSPVHGLTYDCRQCKYEGVKKWRAEKKAAGTRDSTLSPSV